MTTMLIANNCTRENGQFMGDQLCYVKIAYLMVQNSESSKVLMSMSPHNEMAFVWQKFIDTYGVEVVYDEFNPGDNVQRWMAWDTWRKERCIEGRKFDEYRELYLRIHGIQRQILLCGSERGAGRRNIYEYVYYGQEHLPDTCNGSDWFDDSLFYRPTLSHERDVYIAPHCKTQGNMTFTFSYWEEVIRHLLSAGVSVTVGYDGPFGQQFADHPLYKKHWGDHKDWFTEVCKHKLVACGNTGTGWVAAACGVPLITMEPHNSCMADHRYRQCGLRNLLEVVDGFTLDSLNNDMSRVAEYCAARIIAYVKQKVVMTTGCYDVLHAGHVLHLARSRALGTKLVVAMNSDSSVRSLKGESRPVNSQEHRRAVLEAVRYVDEVRVFDGPDARNLIEEMRPDVLTCGLGYRVEDIVGRELVGSAVVTCTEDSAPALSTTGIVKALRIGDMVEVCRHASAVSVNSFSKLSLLADHFLNCTQLSGDIADVGTYRGGSAYVLKCLAPNKHLHMFDTWTGVPYDDPLCHHKKGEWTTSLKDCKKFVGEGPLTHFHQGVFPDWDTDCYFCFVYVDTDTYQSVKDAVAFFWPKMVYGGKMVFDDYGWEPCAGVKKAVDEDFREKTVIANQYTCVVTKR